MSDTQIGLTILGGLILCWYFGLNLVLRRIERWLVTYRRKREERAEAEDDLMRQSLFDHLDNETQHEK